MRLQGLLEKAISELEIKENGMAISSQTIAHAADKGFKITEVPNLIYIPQMAGPSTP
jgi:hypothetical protein